MVKIGPHGLKSVEIDKNGQTDKFFQNGSNGQNRSEWVNMDPYGLTGLSRVKTDKILYILIYIDKNGSNWVFFSTRVKRAI